MKVIQELLNSISGYDPAPEDTDVESGDFIYVPKETKTEFKDWVSIVSQIAGTLVGLLTIYKYWDVVTKDRFRYI